MLARCAAWSMPRARPEAMTKPASPRSRASVPANFSPAPEALREPTIAMTGRISSSSAPRTPSKGGASSSTASRGGYPASSGARRLTPSRWLAASSARASSSLQIRPGRAAPPRRARSGSRSIRCASVRCVVLGVLMSMRSPAGQHGSTRGSGEGGRSSFPDVQVHIVDAPLGASPESILPVVVMDSGLAPSDAPRNDGQGRLPHPLALRKSGPVFAGNEIMPMMSLAELQRRVDSGDLSADAAITQSLEAIGAHEKTIGAFVCRNEAVRAANAGPLRGIAVGIKDIIDTSDFPTQMGSKIYSGWQPRADAPVVMMLKQAGASIVGKTTTTAFASVDPTATLNPRNPNHTPGGSSSGS